MAPISKGKPEDFDPPFFWTPVCESDVESLSAQCAGRRFDPSIVRFVAKRCAYGFPQVIVCHPLAGGSPFPTLFWLTCPYLDKKCGALESEQKIHELEKIFAAEALQVLEFHKKYAELRTKLIYPEELEKIRAEHPAFLQSLSETGVGGINYSVSATAPKCLHLQTASWLGMGEHPAIDWLHEELGELDCPENLCAGFCRGK